MELLPWGSPSFFVRLGLLVWCGMAETTKKPLVLKYFGRTCNFKDVTEMKSCRADRSVRWMSNSRGGTLWIAYLERGLVF